MERYRPSPGGIKTQRPSLRRPANPALYLAPSAIINPQVAALHSPLDREQGAAGAVEVRGNVTRCVRYKRTGATSAASRSNAVTSRKCTPAICGFVQLIN